MLRFVLRRLATGLAMVVVISSLAFLLLNMSGANIARNILGQNATEEQVAAKSHELGLDQNVFSRFFGWLGDAVTGNFGVSYFGAAPVTQQVASRLGVTLSLVILATLISAIIAVLIGVWAAVKRGWVDKAVQVTSLAFAAIPNYLIALALVLILAINLGWLRPTGYTRPGDSISGWALSILLPVIALAVGCIAGVAQQVRGSMIDGMRQDYVRTLRARGVPERSILYKHVLRNAAGPALSILALNFVGLLGGAVVIEQMFAVPGLGSLSVAATTRGDIPVVMGVVVVVAIIVILVNLVIDILQGWLNPKVRVA